MRCKHEMGWIPYEKGLTWGCKICGGIYGIQIKAKRYDLGDDSELQDGD
jgi:hypothetical protein